jgi:Flp pilus assembly pilin Flp
MTNLIKNFAKSESGAVTVDWVVLTAAIVGLGLAVMAVVSDGIGNLSNDIDTQLTGQAIATTFTAEQLD